MEVKDSPEDAEFRVQAREGLEDTMLQLGGVEPARLEDKLDYWRTWQGFLFHAGYAGLSWPKEYGGRGATLTQQSIFIEEMARAAAPPLINVLGVSLLGPTLIAYGSPDQKKRFLAPILAADEIWCQGYSEPNAGSDNYKNQAQRGSPRQQ